MAEEIENGTASVETEPEVETDETKPNEENTPEGVFTQADLEERLKAHEELVVARLKTEQEESQKLANMTEKDKVAYEKQKAEERIAELEREVKFHAMAKTAATILSERGIASNEEILQFVTKDTAEDTKVAIDSFAGMVEGLVKEGVKSALKGKTPTTFAQTTTTKADILQEKDPVKRQQLMRENIELFTGGF